MTSDANTDLSLAINLFEKGPLQRMSAISFRFSPVLRAPRFEVMDGPLMSEPFRKFSKYSHCYILLPRDDAAVKYSS
jgi:hypothetical protein